MSCCSGKRDRFLFLSDLFLLVYRNAGVICVLILYLPSLLNSLMSSHNFLVASLSFSMCSIMLSANRESLLLFQFGFLSFLTTLVRSSKTMLSRNGDNGHPGLFADTRGNAFSFSLSRMMLTVSFQPFF